MAQLPKKPGQTRYKGRSATHANKSGRRSTGKVSGGIAASTMLHAIRRRPIKKGY